MNTSEAIKLLETSGYRVSRIGVKGRRSKLQDVPLEQMTPQQRKTFLWRQKNREKVLEYHRNYNKRRKLMA